MKVTSIRVISGGIGWFDEPPIVSMYGGGGTSARAVARVHQGRVIGVDVLDGGVNYSEAPEVRFDGGGKAQGHGTVAEAVIGKGGRPFADQPVPKPENPPKDAKSTTPVMTDNPSLKDERRPLQPSPHKGTPDEEEGMQHTESHPKSVTEQIKETRGQFNPGGSPLPGNGDDGLPRETPRPQQPAPAPKPQQTPASPQRPQAPHQRPQAPHQAPAKPAEEKPGEDKH